MKTKIFYLIIFVLNLTDIFGQIEPKLWYFGQGCGIDFNFSPARLLQNTLSSNPEGGVTITKDDGTLLLFVNIDEIYNANGVIMKNGKGLIGNFGSSAQSPIVLQHPTAENLLYLFYAADHGENIGQLRYSIIDLCGDDGLGEVIPTKKNVLIQGVFSERLSFAYNKSENYYWILAGTWDHHSIRAYKLDEFGLNLTPIISDINENSNPSYIGMINLSKDYTKLTYTCCLSGGFRGAKYGEFNINSGKVTNMEDFIHGEVYDCTFSNDNKFIYFTELWGESKLSRFSIIDKSIVKIDSRYGNYEICALEMGPDGNIYVANQVSNSIGLIENVGNSDEKYTPNKFEFNSPNNVKYGLQSSNRIYKTLNNNTVNLNVLGNDTTVCDFDNLILKSGLPNSIWSNGQVGEDIVVKGPGIYFFRNTSCNIIISDTIEISFQESKIENTFHKIVDCNEVYLSSKNSNSSTIWNTGEVGDSLFKNKTGIYWSMTKFGCDTFIDTFDVKIEHEPVMLQPKYTLCKNGLSGLYLFNNQDVLWSNGQINDSLLIVEGGNYYFTISNSCGEFKSVTDVVDFTNLVLPNIFSPNGDNINDYFPGYTFSIPPYNLEIYDRWGELIFKGDHDWDGNFDNLAVADGVYVYILSYPYCNSSSIGTITVFR